MAGKEVRCKVGVTAVDPRGPKIIFHTPGVETKCRGADLSFIRDERELVVLVDCLLIELYLHPIFETIVTDMLSKALSASAFAATAHAVSVSVASEGGNATSPYAYGFMFEVF